MTIKTRKPLKQARDRCTRCQKEQASFIASSDEDSNSMQTNMPSSKQLIAIAIIIIIITKLILTDCKMQLRIFV